MRHSAMMLGMTKEDILHLGALARIKMSDEKAEQFKGEIDSILSYISAVSDIAATGSDEKQLTPRFNVFRDDIVTNEPGSYTEAIVAEFPDRHGPYLKVKKILGGNDE